MEVSEQLRWATTPVVSTGEVGWGLPPQKRWRWGWGNSSEELGFAEWLSKSLGGTLFRQIRGDLRDPLQACLWRLHFEMRSAWFAGKKFSAEEAAPA